MIVKSQVYLSLGKYHYQHVNDGAGNPHKIRFLVLRETTRDEYIKNTPSSSIGTIFDDDKFYEISTD